MRLIGVFVVQWKLGINSFVQYLVKHNRRYKVQKFSNVRMACLKSLDNMQPIPTNDKPFSFDWNYYINIWQYMFAYRSLLNLQCLLQIF